MILEIFLIGVVVFLALTFFYKQAICEFRLNQIEWEQVNKLPDLFNEKVPIVIRGKPSTAFWTQEDVLLRECYSRVRIFEEEILSDWLLRAEPTALCPWGAEHAGILGGRGVSGLTLWAERTLDPIIMTNPFLKLWLNSTSQCWAGERGLVKTVAPWTAIFVTQGAAVVTIMTEAAESALPLGWKRGKVFPSRLTAYDTPFVGDLKFMDIVARPGNILLIPAHWFISWTTLDNGEAENAVCPMVCSVEYHTPISRFAGMMAN